MTSLSVVIFVALLNGPQEHVAAPSPEEATAENPYQSGAKPLERASPVASDLRVRRFDAMNTGAPDSEVRRYSFAPDCYAKNGCVQCHRNLAGRSAEIVDLEWAKSMHYENNVGCDGCHGGDASLTRDQFPSEETFKEAAHLGRSPEFVLFRGSERSFVSRARGRSISYFCGRCHTEIMEKHLGSPHGNFGDPSCLYCHGRGSHAILHATIDIIDTRPRSESGRCALCHQAATMQVVADLKEILETTAARIDSSAEEFIKLEELGYRNLALAEMHHHTADTHSRLRRVFHSFNMRDVSELARSIESVGQQTDYTHGLVQSLHRARKTQTVVGLGAVVFLLAFAGLLVFYKKVYLDHHDHAAPASDDA